MEAEVKVEVEAEVKVEVSIPMGAAIFTGTTREMLL